MTECAFPWHSQEQVAPKLWKSTFPSSCIFGCTRGHGHLSHGRLQQQVSPRQTGEAQKSGGLSQQRKDLETLCGEGRGLRDKVSWMLPLPPSVFFFFIAFTPTVVNQLLCCCCCSVLCFISFSHETMNLAKEGTTPDSLETILLRSSGVSCTQQVLNKCLRTY